MFARSLVTLGLLLAANACAPHASAVSLDVPVRASFQHMPLRVLLTRLGKSTGTPLVLDRQIDPNQPITVTARGEPLHDVLNEIGHLIPAEVATLDASVWLVPPGEAERYEAADQLRQSGLARLPDYIQTAFSQREKLDWEAGATPLELMDQLMSEARQRHLFIKLLGVDEVIPHDHLPTSSLPAMTLAERFDVVAMQYGFRVDWSRSRNKQQITGRLLPLSAPLATNTARVPRRSTVPSTTRRNHRPAAGDEPRFTLRAAAPLTNLIHTVASQFNLTPVIDTTALRQRGIDPQTIVRLEVTDADRDELLAAIVSPLGLTWSITGTTLTVTTQPASNKVRP